MVQQFQLQTIGDYRKGGDILLRAYMINGEDQTLCIYQNMMDGEYLENLWRSIRKGELISADVEEHDGEADLKLTNYNTLKVFVENPEVPPNSFPVESLEIMVQAWAEQKGIYQSGDSKTQYLKLIEEVGELAQAILKKDTPELVDAVGDIQVVLINLLVLYGLENNESFSMGYCLESAYNVISKRTGHMENGTFVKDTNVS